MLKYYAILECSSWNFLMLGVNATVSIAAGDFFCHICGQSPYQVCTAGSTLAVSGESLAISALGSLCLWDRFINTKGGLGKKIPCDLHNEHMNKLLKEIVANNGPKPDTSRTTACC